MVVRCRATLLLFYLSTGCSAARHDSCRSATAVVFDKRMLNVACCMRCQCCRCEALYHVFHRRSGFHDLRTLHVSTNQISYKVL